MALPDPQVNDVRERRGERWHRLLGVLTTGLMGGALTLWILEQGTVNVLVQGLADRLFMVAALLVVTWMILWAHLRQVRQLRQLEGNRYRDGYAAGYLDAITRPGDEPGDRRLRPVK
jgi:hypothetical protein